MSDTVLIAGAGAPNGVGAAVARTFARQGLHVVVSGRTLEKVETTAAEIVAEGGSAEALAVDVTSADDQDRLFARAEARGEPVAAVIFNAGANQPIPFEDLTPDQFETFWRIGCYGAFLTAKRAMPMLAAQGRGSMLFTGASASMRGRPMFAHFAASKSALRNLAQALAREYGPKGVHVAHVVVDGVINGDVVRGRFGDYLGIPGRGRCPRARRHRRGRSGCCMRSTVRPGLTSWTSGRSRRPGSPIRLLQSPDQLTGGGAMSTKHLLAEELHPIIELIPSADITEYNLPKLREMGATNLVMGDAEAAGVVREEIVVPGEGHDVRCLLYRPARAGTGRPGYLHIHGGGYIMGAVEGSDISNIAICANLDVVVLSVDYRLAPEHPIPAPLDDCYAGLAWLHRNAESLGVSPDRIGVGGESAGGGLAAALAIRARDAGDYAICHQHLTYPMLDNLTGTKSNPGDPLVGEFIWTRARNQFGWRSYLGDAPAEAPQVPARVERYEGLPGTWMFTAALDLFRDENIAYAQNLLEAGVGVELLLYPGACHGFQMLPGTQLASRFAEDHMTALARGLGVEL